MTIITDWLNEWNKTARSAEHETGTLFRSDAFPLTSRFWESLRELPPAAQLTAKDKQAIGNTHSAFYSRLEASATTLLVHNPNEKGWEDANMSLANLADKDYPAAAVIFGRVQSALAQEDPSRLVVAERYFEQAKESLYTSPQMRQLAELCQLANNAAFDQMFPNMHQGKNTPTLSKEARAKMEHAMAFLALAAQDGDVYAYRRLRTLAIRGYHGAQWGCATVELNRSSNTKRAASYLNMLKNNKCKDISENKKWNKDKLDLAIRGEALKGLPAEKKAEEKDKLDEEIRIRYEKRSYDTYTEDDRVLLKTLALANIPRAQQLMVGYYKAKNDTVGADEMADLLEQNPENKPEKTYQYLRRNYREEVGRRDQDIRQNQEEILKPMPDNVYPDEAEGLDTGNSASPNTPQTEGKTAEATATAAVIAPVSKAVEPINRKAAIAAPQPQQPKQNINRATAKEPQRTATQYRGYERQRSRKR